MLSTMDEPHGHNYATTAQKSDPVPSLALATTPCIFHRADRQQDLFRSYRHKTEQQPEVMRRQQKLVTAENPLKTHLSPSRKIQQQDLYCATMTPLQSCCDWLALFMRYLASIMTWFQRCPPAKAQGQACPPGPLGPYCMS